MPPGADRIVVQEIVERDGDRIRIAGEPGAASFVRAAGCDFAAGETLIRAGDLLTPARIGLAAAANLATLEVRRRPRVASCPRATNCASRARRSTAGRIVNSAAYALAELVAAWGGDPVRHPILPDDRAAARRRSRPPISTPTSSSRSAAPRSASATCSSP